MTEFASPATRQLLLTAVFDCWRGKADLTDARYGDGAITPLKGRQRRRTLDRTNQPAERIAMRAGTMVSAFCLALAACNAVVAATAATEPTPRPQTYFMFVFNEAAPGQEAEYNRWYDQQHAPDVLVNPSYESAQRYVAVEQLDSPTKPPAKYLIAFEIVSTDIGRSFQYIHDNIRNGRTVQTSSIARGIGGDMSYRALASPVRGRHPGTPTAGHYLEIAFGTRDDPQALSRAAAIPGVRQAQRFELSPVQLTPNTLPVARRYMTMYLLDVAPAGLARLQRAIGASGAQAPGGGSTVGTLTYRALGPRQSGAEVKQDRGAVAPRP